MKAGICGACVLAILTAVLVRSTPAALAQGQAPVCLHGPTEAPAEKARRSAAVGYARSVNTAQAAFHRVHNRSAETLELQGAGAAPPGFVLQHAADTDGYIFSVKDATDPCGFALFSDQRGVIYVGATMR